MFILSTSDITIEYVENLYNKYYQDLVSVKELQLIRYKDLMSKVSNGCMFDDIECELLYMLVRDRIPANIIEFAPYCGWSTSWVIEALNTNNKGKCSSFDIADYSKILLPQMKDICCNRWSLKVGDVQKEYANFNLGITDFIFIDCVHTDVFANRYIKEVIEPAMAEPHPITCVIHDIYSTNLTEGKTVREFLNKHNIPNITAGIGTRDREVIDVIRNRLGLDMVKIHISQVNPAVFFCV